MKTNGENLFSSDKIQSNIQALLEEATRVNAAITEVSGPKEELMGKASEVMDRAGENRGRPLFYRYIGSGAGNGALVELIDGSIKLDLINGIGIHILGHSHPKVMEASIKASLSDIVMQGNLQPNLEYVGMGDRLVKYASRKSRLRHAWITTSGSMANEIALKISRQKNSPARKVLAMKDAFAGRTTMMTEIGDNPAHSVGQPRYNEVLRVPFLDSKDPKSAENSLKIMREHIDKNKGDISAFVFEPVQGEGGFRVGTPEFFNPLFDLCKENDIAVWADEVQTFCRSGELFAFEKLGIGEKIDIVSLAKTVQVGATLYTPEYNPQPGLIAGTFAGTSVALAAGNAILDEMTSGKYLGEGGRVEEIYNLFMKEFNALADGSCKGILSDAGGVGLMIAVTPFGGDKDKVSQLLKVLYSNGLMAFSCGHGPYRLRFLVPASIKDSEIKLAGQILEKSLLEMNV